MSTLYIFNFDGTCNSPDDAVQGVDSDDRVEDDSITNILKFHLLCGGSLTRQGQGWSPSQQCYYYPGVGTYGSWLQKAINAVFAPGKGDVRTVLRRALADFDSLNFNAGSDFILVTGFSRGAALARRFAKLVSDRVPNSRIYEAVFDTVASIGLPNLSRWERPESEVVFENQSLPQNVVKALHIVSLDEKRSAFQPTLMNQENKVTEIWFPGAHADVGGGYNKDSLSDVALRYFINWIQDLLIEIEIRQPQHIQYSTLLPQGIPYEIGEDDVTINATPLGTSHEQSWWHPLSVIRFSHRRCCVIKGDKVTEEPPFVHWTVANRIYHLQDYRPKSLKNIKHLLLYQDGETIPSKGIRAHIELPQQNLSILQPGESKTVTVFASERYNRTGLFLEKGKNYTFEVLPAEKWKDGSIECNAGGWDRAGVKLGLKELPIAGFEPFRRVPDAKWFELCASLGSSDDEAFRIGLSSTYTANSSGEFCPFANDLERFYGNNEGKLTCVVSCTAVQS